MRRIDCGSLPTRRDADTISMGLYHRSLVLEIDACFGDWPVLQIVPDTNIDVDLKNEENDEIYCANCGHVITRGRWRISMNGGHEHTFFNPAGQIFRVVCFKEASGVGTVGSPSSDFTWFRDYMWEVVGCIGCSTHLGWRFTGGGRPAVFFGLIKPRLTAKKS